MKQDKIHKFVGDQLSLWPLACSNFRALKDVKVREIEVGGLTVKLQFNPARMISSAAKLNKEDIAKRRCFLCRENRPVEQIMLKFEGRKNKKYDILVNPYPIFPDHLVIAKSNHTDQSIWHRYVDMLDLANMIMKLPVQKDMVIDDKRYLFAHAMTSYPLVPESSEYYLMGNYDYDSFLLDGIEGYISMCGHTPTGNVLWKDRNLYMDECQKSIWHNPNYPQSHH